MNRYQKGKRPSFYHFPKDPERRKRWIIAVNRKDWTPTDNSWICSEHFIQSKSDDPLSPDNLWICSKHFIQFQSDDPLSPDYVPSLFKYLGSPAKRYRLGLHQSTVSRNIRKWINIMYIRLRPLVKWPEREDLLITMPMEIRRNFKHCTIIIDRFEIFCECPTNLKARAQLWSNYKHHNTVKYLIGIAPQGVITFISKGWGGRVSDVHLTENCGLIEKLIPGDVILADRGFTIQESVGMYCAEVKIPAFTRGKKQLSRCEVDTSRQLSRVRIHVERVIGVLR